MQLFFLDCWAVDFVFMCTVSQYSVKTILVVSIVINYFPFENFGWKADVTKLHNPIRKYKYTFVTEVEA